MKDKILYIYIFLFVIFADTYFVVTWLKPITILNYILLVVYISNNRTKLPRELIKFRNIFFLFVIFTFLVDIYQNEQTEAVAKLITLFPIPYIFSLFYTSTENNKLIFFYAKIYLIYNGIFSLLQFIGFYYTAGEILAFVPMIEVDQGFASDFGNQGLRVSGASFSSIGFACNLGILFCYFYFNEIKIYSKKTRLIFLVILVFLMLLTQTRSLLFGILPVIYLTNNIISKNKTKMLVLSIISVGILAVVLTALLPFLEEQFPRLFLTVEEDSSVIHRIQANVYGVIGTLLTAPLIGVPYEKGLEAMYLGYQKIGLFIGERFIDEQTQHNQPAYFMRYYGIIGFSFFILIYNRFFKIALMQKNNMKMKKVLFSILLFYFLYTLTHNNKITMDFYLYIFLALNTKVISENFNKTKEKHAKID